MTCQNPECYCHEAGIGLTKPFISGKDRDMAFRSAISKLNNARNEIARMITEGQCEHNLVLNWIDEAVEAMEEQHVKAAKEFGFTIRPGIGPGDRGKADGLGAT